MEIDHIDGDKTNNRLENLQLADHYQNMHNHPKLKTNTSGVKGISWNKSNNRWDARIQCYENKYQKNYEEFSSNVPDTHEGHWISKLFICRKPQKHRQMTPFGHF